MRKFKTVVGVYRDINYTLIHDRLENQQACDSRHKSWVWVLLVDADYQGIFERKTDAYDYLEELAEKAA